VLAPPSPRMVARLRLHPECAVAAGLAPEPAVLHAAYRDNPAAHSLPLLMALARRQPCTLILAAGAALNLRMEISF